MADQEGTCVALTAADFTLKTLDFAASTLTAVSPLRVNSYTLGPLIFDAPYAAPSVPGVWRIIWCANDGCPPHIPPDMVPEMIAKMKQRIIELQAARRFKRIGRKDPAVMAYARELAAKAGIETSDFTLLKYVIRPAFQSLELES